MNLLLEDGFLFCYHRPDIVIQEGGRAPQQTPTPPRVEGAHRSGGPGGRRRPQSAGTLPRFAPRCPARSHRRPSRGRRWPMPPAAQGSWAHGGGAVEVPASPEQTLDHTIPMQNAIGVVFISFIKKNTLKAEWKRLVPWVSNSLVKYRIRNLGGIHPPVRNDDTNPFFFPCVVIIVPFASGIACCE